MSTPIITLRNFRDKTEGERRHVCAHYASAIQPTRAQLRNMKKDELVEYALDAIDYLNEEIRWNETQRRRMKQWRTKERETILQAWSHVHPDDLRYMQENPESIYDHLLYSYGRPDDEGKVRTRLNTAIGYPEWRKA